MDNPNLESEILHKVSGICRLLNLSGVNSITDIQKYAHWLAHHAGTRYTSPYSSELFPPSTSPHSRCMGRKNAPFETYKACLSTSALTTHVTSFSCPNTVGVGRELSGEQQLLLLADEKRKRVYDYQPSLPTKKGLRKEGNETSSDLPHMLTADTEEYPKGCGMPVPDTTRRKSFLLAKQHAQSAEQRTGTKKAATPKKDSSGSSRELLQAGKKNP